MAGVPTNATTLLAEMVSRLSSKSAKTPTMDEDFPVPILEISSY
jgi:hypothetical protein